MSTINKKKYNKRVIKETTSKQFPLLNLYILCVIILQLIGDLFNIYILKMLKPVPITMMIAYIHMKNSSREHLIASLVQYGLIFSLIGDLLLMVPQYQAFALGTGFFLVAHFIYIFAFVMGFQIRRASLQTKFLMYGGVLFCIANNAFNSYMMWDVLPSKILFPFYGGVVCLNAVVAILRYEKTTPYSYLFILVGSLLFGISDSLLGFLKFNHIHTSLGRAVIMLTYYSAQYLIMHGSLHHSNLQHNINQLVKGKTTI